MHLHLASLGLHPGFAVCYPAHPVALLARLPLALDTYGLTRGYGCPASFGRSVTTAESQDLAPSSPDPNPTTTREIYLKQLRNKIQGANPNDHPKDVLIYLMPLRARQPLGPIKNEISHPAENKPARSH